MAFTPVSNPPEIVVLSWIDAFNARDLDGVLAWMDPDVVLHPMRLPGLEHTYRGHDGVTRWFASIEGLGLEHRFHITDLSVDSGEVMGVGKLALTPVDDPTGIWILDRVANGLIVHAHHYLTDRDAFPRSSADLGQPIHSERSVQSALRPKLPRLLPPLDGARANSAKRRADPAT